MINITARCVCIVGLCFGTLGCGLGSLSTGDESRPSIGPNDTVTLSPECIALSISSSVVATTQQVLSVAARRVTGAGAESVPVEFKLGFCADSQGAHVARPDCDTHADEASDGGQNQTCDGTTKNMLSHDPGYLSRFGLVTLDATRCSATSKSLVECVLDRSGSMTVGVEVSTLAGDAGVLATPLAAPLCVAVREVGEQMCCGDACNGWISGRDGWRRKQIVLVPTSDSSSVRADFTSFGAPATTCNRVSDAAGCDAKQDVLATLVVGLVNDDLPRGSVIPQSAFVIPKTPIPATVSISAANSSFGLATSAADCLDGKALQSVMLPASTARLAGPIVVCGNHAGGQFSLHATLKEVTGDYVATIAPSLVTLRIAAGAQSPLRARYCDAPDERDVLSDEVQAVIYTDGSIPELHPMATGTPLLLQAPRQCSGDGGVGCDLTVVFAGGQVCPVQVVP